MSGMADTGLYTLLNDASITTLIDSFTVGVTSYPAIANDFVIPASWNVEKAINFYRTSPSGPENYRQYNYSVNCRARKKSVAESIAAAVETIVHRGFNDGAYFTVSVLPTIPPQDETDLYNAPLEVRAKRRR